MGRVALRAPGLKCTVSSATLAQFAAVNDSAAATTKKLQKQAILAEYFRTLEESDLRLAVRYAAGRAFASTDDRTLNVGGAIVREVVLELLRADPRSFGELIVRSGEIGEALSKIWPVPAEAAEPEPELSLAELSAGFDSIARVGSWDAKKSLVRELYARCQTGREAAYLSKIIFGDLRTGVQEGVLQAAISQAFDKAQPIIRKTQLLVGDLEEVAVLARQDALESATFRLFHPIGAMLATPKETPADLADAIVGRTFAVEDKLDGIRAQVHKAGGTGAEARVAIYTRTLDRTDAGFPDVVQSISQIPGEFLLDGEIVPWRGGQVLPFAHIQKRLGRKVLSRRMLEENPAAFIAFDMLYLNGRLLMDEPLSSRRGELAALAASMPPAALLTTDAAVVSSEIEIAQMFEAARQRRNEGIMLKDMQSPYLPGRRGQMWFKLKTHLPTFDCVVTAAEHGHGKRRDSLSDYTFAVWDREPDLPDATLVNIGKAYSGVTDEEIAQLTELFTRISISFDGRRHQVGPKVVLEIACDQIQKSARHASGYALRFPRIKRIRWDKAPRDADRLERIVEIYESTPNFARPTETPPTKSHQLGLFDGLDAV